MAQLLQNRLHPGYGPGMEVPKSLRIGTVKPFNHLVRRWAALNPEPVPDIAGLEGQWLEVSGGPLPLPIAIRVDKAEDGRFIVTGLLIGLRSRREITWETLRLIKPSTILSHIFAGFDAKEPQRLHRETGLDVITVEPGEDFDEKEWASGHDHIELPPVLITSESWREHNRGIAALDLWRGAGRDEEAGRPVEAVTRPRASVATNLTEFAETYLRHLAATPHRATTATAQELHISRATAIRRLAEARELNLIPPKGKKA